MSGIVYCLSKKDTETVATQLAEAGLRTASYHAVWSRDFDGTADTHTAQDMTPDSRKSVHQRWTRNEIQVVVATLAFGRRPRREADIRVL